MTEEQLQALIQAITTGRIQFNLILLEQDLTNEQALLIAQALFENPTISSVVLSGNPIFKEKNYEVIRALLLNPNIRSLNLSNTGLDDEGFKVLGEALQSNTTLAMLNVNNSMIGKEGYMAFARALQRHPSLKVLRISPHICNKDSKEFCEILANAPLTRLDLHFSSIPANQMLEAIRNNQTLTSLSLFGDSADKSISLDSILRFLNPNKTLATFELSGFSIYGSGRGLRGLLKDNKTLKKLKLYECLLEDARLNQLIHVLRNNTSLESLDLDGNQFTQEGVTAFNKFMQTQKTLKSVMLDREGMWTAPLGKQMLIDMGYLKNGIVTIETGFRSHDPKDKLWAQCPELLRNIQERCLFNRGLPALLRNVFNEMGSPNTVLPNGAIVTIVQYLFNDSFKEIERSFTSPIDLDDFGISKPPAYIGFLPCFSRGDDSNAAFNKAKHKKHEKTAAKQEQTPSDLATQFAQRLQTMVQNLSAVSLKPKA